MQFLLSAFVVLFLAISLQAEPNEEVVVKRGQVVSGGVDAALQQISTVWNGNAVRYWKAALQNNSPYDLIALGTSASAGQLDTSLPNIPSGMTGLFVWIKSSGTATGASGVAYFRVGNTGRIISVMASVPYDFNLYSTYANCRVSTNQESYSNLYNGKNGCAYPTRGGNWAQVDGCMFNLQNKSQAEFRIIFSG